MAETKEQKKARNATWYKKNRAKILKRQKLRRESNRDEMNLKSREKYRLEKDTVKIRRKKYYYDNKEIISEKAKKKRILNRDEMNAQKKESAKRVNENRSPEEKEKELERNRKKNKKFREENPYYGKNWHQRNKKRITAKNKKRMVEDPNYRLIVLMRVRIRKAILNNLKIGSVIDILGCSIDFLKGRFESMFTEGMSWAKILSGEIDVDHIIPCAIFDFSNPEAQKFCFHYKNLQPLWKLDNIKKSDKVSMEVLLSLDRSLLNEKTLKKIERYETKLKKQTSV